MTQSNHDKSRSLPAMACLDSERRPERLLIVGGSSIHRTNSIGRRLVRHWSGRKQRDVARSIPKQTDAVIVVLDRVSHALARKIRIEAARRGLPILYQKRAHVSGDVSAGPALLHAFRRR